MDSKLDAVRLILWSSQRKQNGKTGMLMFSSDEIEAAKEVCIGKKSYGKVYKGKLRGHDVAIKIFKQPFTNGTVDQFMKEMEVQAQVDHKNINKLIGTCIESRALVYEYFRNGSLDDYLKTKGEILIWELRTRIVYQTCTALMYLHSKPKPLVHGNIRPGSILLDDYLNVKIGDFGSAFEADFFWRRSPMDSYGSSVLAQQMMRFFSDVLQVGRPPMREQHIANRVTDVSYDVYSFGVTILEILTGTSIHGDTINIMGTAYEKDRVMELVDNKAGIWPENVAKLLAYFGLTCCMCNTDKVQIMIEISTDLLGILNQSCFSAQHEEEEEAIFSLDMLSKLNIKLFKDRDIELAAVEDLKELGEGGGGSVYKTLLEGKEVAIKVLHSDDDHNKREFSQEVEILGALKHEYLVGLVGVCLDPMCLIYEFLQNGSVEKCLANNPRALDWRRRIRILYQTCEALMFLHSVKPNPIAHGDLKPDNVLLDANYNAKLADFGLSRVLADGTHSRAFKLTEIAKGTESYIDPEFIKTKILTPACDVYSFGIMILKLLVAEAPKDITRKVRKARKNNKLMDLVDRNAGDWPRDAVDIVAYSGLICCGKERIRWSETLEEVSKLFKSILDATNAGNSDA